MLEQTKTDAPTSSLSGLHAISEAQLNGVELWDEEYGADVTTIPSSHRAEPAHALKVAMTDADLLSGTGLDLGCGNGRNARFLAKQGLTVSALDFSTKALSILKDSSSTYVDDFMIEPILHDIRKGLPFADGEKDFVLDAYCLCHFIDSEGYEGAMKEVARVLRPGGTYLKIHLDAFDEYYLQRIKSETAFGHISYDTSNKIHKRHYVRTEFEKELRHSFKLNRFWQVDFNDVVRGKSVKRSVFTTALTRH